MDSVTGIHHVFCGYGGTNNRFVRGGYNATTGLIDWEAATPELTGSERMLSAGDCNGVLYACIGGNGVEGDGIGGVFWREDGPTPAVALRLRMVGGRHQEPRHPRLHRRAASEGLRLRRGARHPGKLRHRLLHRPHRRRPAQRPRRHRGTEHPDIPRRRVERRRVHRLPHALRLQRHAGNPAPRHRPARALHRRGGHAPARLRHGRRQQQLLPSPPPRRDLRVGPCLRPRRAAAKQRRRRKRPPRHPRRRLSPFPEDGGRVLYFSGFDAAPSDTVLSTTTPPGFTAPSCPTNGRGST